MKNILIVLMIGFFLSGACSKGDKKREAKANIVTTENLRISTPKLKELESLNEKLIYIIVGLSASTLILAFLWWKARRKHDKIDRRIIDVIENEFFKNKNLVKYKTEWMGTSTENFNTSDLISFISKAGQLYSNQPPPPDLSKNWLTIENFAKSKVDGLESEKDVLNMLKEAIIDYAHKASEELEPTISPIVKSVVPDNEPSGLKFYFNNPTKSGFFNDEQRSVNRTSETLFEFILNNTNPNEASYFISASPDAIPSALNFHDYRIEPVCDCENVYEPNHKNIINKGAGKARLEDGKWIIKQAAKVQYV